MSDSSESTPANPANRKDPLTAFCFSLEIQSLIGEKQAFFKSVSGLKNESEVVPYREGGLNSYTHQLVGPTKWPNLVLKRGFALGGYELIKWRQLWLADGLGEIKRVRGRIIQYNSEMKGVCSWTFLDGWPCKWEGPDYDGSKMELAIETIEIAHSGLFFSPSG